MTLNMINLAISPAKANRLYWLGRYVERAATSLHLLRRYNDDIIDNENSEAHKEFCRLMGIACDYSNARTFVRSFLYDLNNPSSISSILENVKNNAMLERGDIRSESLAYIEMAINYMDNCRRSEKELYDLQYVSDMLLSFWGAIEEYIHFAEVRRLLYIGRFVEKADLMIRFDYEEARIEDVLTRLEGFCDNTKSTSFCHKDDLALIRSSIEASTYKYDGTLSRINSLFAA